MGDGFHFLSSHTASSHDTKFVEARMPRTGRVMFRDGSLLRGAGNPQKPMNCAQETLLLGGIRPCVTNTAP